MKTNEVSKYSAESHQSEASSTDYVRRTLKGKYRKLSAFDYISLFLGYMIIALCAFLGVIAGIGYLSDLLLPVIDSALKFMYEHILLICGGATLLFVVCTFMPDFVKSDKSNKRYK